MLFQEDGCDFSLSFHLVNDKGNHGEVKPSGRRVEVKGQFNSVFKGDMELELVEVDCNGVSFLTFRHFFTPGIWLKRLEILSEPEVIKKCYGTYRTYHHKPYHMLKIASISK